MSKIINKIYTLTKHIKVKTIDRYTEMAVVNVLNSEETFNISLSLFATYLSGDGYSEVVQINKTSSYNPDGSIKEIGLNDIFKNIGDEVFSVFFRKASKTKTKKQIDEENKVIETKLIAQVENVFATLPMKAAVAQIIELTKSTLAPVSETIEGEPRKLRGIKLTKFSSDGMYDVLDFDEEYDETKPGCNQRKVNLQNVMALVYSDKLYLRKDLKLTEEKLLKLF